MLYKGWKKLVRELSFAALRANEKRASFDVAKHSEKRSSEAPHHRSCCFRRVSYGGDRRATVDKEWWNEEGLELWESKTDKAGREEETREEILRYGFDFLICLIVFILLLFNFPFSFNILTTVCIGWSWWMGGRGFVFQLPCKIQFIHNSYLGNYYLFCLVHINSHLQTPYCLFS